MVYSVLMIEHRQTKLWLLRVLRVTDPEARRFVKRKTVQLQVLVSKMAPMPPQLQPQRALEAMSAGALG